MRLRINFSKVGSARFFSHLEMQEMWKRALRRADVPFKISQGYNPQPKMSFASALPVGVFSLNEYLDVELKDYTPVMDTVNNINSYLPSGLKIKKTAFVNSESRSLMGIVNRAEYIIIQELNENFENIQDKADKYLNLSAIEVMSFTKKGEKLKNIKDGIYRFNANFNKGRLYITSLVQTGSSGNVKPGDMLKSFLDYLNAEKSLPEVIIRRDLYIEDGGKLINPIDILEG